MKRSVDTRKILVLCLFSMLLVSFVAGIVSAAPVAPYDDLKAWLSGQGGSFKLYSAQFLFLLLVTLIIFAVTNFIPFLEGANPWLRFGVALIIGILSTLYLAPEEVYTALMGYESLGIILTTIVPFVVLLTITIQWDTRYPEYSFFTQIIWIGYLAAYFIKFWGNLWSWFTTGNAEIGGFGLAFVLITGITSLIMAIAGGYISRWIFRKRLKGLIIKGKLKTEAEITGHINTIRNYMANTPELAGEYNEIIKELEKALSKTRQSST